MVNRILTSLFLVVLLTGCTVGSGNGIFPPGADMSAEPPVSGLDDGRDYRILVANGLGETITLVERENETWSVTENVMQTGQSPNELIYHNGHCYLVNSLSNSIQIFDPNTFETVREISTGAGTNPMDIDFYTGEIAVVTCHLSNEIVLIDISEDPDGDRILDRIAMPSSDELPHDEGVTTYARPGGICVVENTAYVACANLDVFSTAGGPGILVEIDLETRELANTIVMNGRNTSQVLYSQRFPARLIVMSAGDYEGVTGYTGNGMVESIDLNSGEIFQAIEINGAPLSGVIGQDDILHCENASEGKVIRLDLHTGLELDGYSLPDYGEQFSFASSLISLPGLLLVTNFNSDRLHIIDPSNGEILAELATGDGPDSISLVE